MSTRIDPTAPNQGKYNLFSALRSEQFKNLTYLLDISGPGESAAAAEGSLEQQNYHHFYNQYYGHHNPNQHHQAGN